MTEETQGTSNTDQDVNTDPGTVEPVVPNPTVIEPTVTDPAINEEMQEAELDALKIKAQNLGLTYHPKIKYEALSKKIDAHLKVLDTRQKELADKNKDKYPENPKELLNTPKSDQAPAPAIGDDAAPVMHKTGKLTSKDKALALVRVQITCMDPAKSAYDGDIFTVGNSLIPPQKKFVPFGKDYHIPQIMFNMLNEKNYKTTYEEKTSNGGNVKRTRLVKAYAIAVLPPLTPAELHDIKQRQVMAAAGTV